MPVRFQLTVIIFCFSFCSAQHIMSEPEEITTMSGQKLQLKMSVDYISFSAHTDYQQTSEFIRALKPPHVVRWDPGGVNKRVRFLFTPSPRKR